MALKGKNKRKKGLSYNRIGMILIALLVSFLLYIVVKKSQDLDVKLAYYTERTESLKEQIENEENRTKEIAALKEYMSTEAYAEEVARNRLGLVKENEIVFQEAAETR